MAEPRISTVIVAYDSLDDLRRTLPPLRQELRDSDELIVVDNGSGRGLQDELPRLAPEARLIIPGANVGFAEGANIGGAAARHELLVLLNPDTVVQPGWAEAIRGAASGRWAGWMALVTMDAGSVVNTAGGVLHFTGLGWAGRLGEPLATLPRTPAEVGFLSGACMALPRATWKDLGGFPPHFFMYCEDVDLSLRLRLRGGRIGVIPSAQVIHNYEFAKGRLKWRLLERNRWATVVRTYPMPLLALVFPALLATDVVIWVVALKGGWARAKAQATGELLQNLPRLVRERRAIQATRAIRALDFATALTWEPSSPYLGGAATSPLVSWALRSYWAVVCSLLRLSERLA